MGKAKETNDFVQGPSKCKLREAPDRIILPQISAQPKEPLNCMWVSDRSNLQSASKSSILRLTDSDDGDIRVQETAAPGQADVSSPEVEQFFWPKQTMES